MKVFVQKSAFVTGMQAEILPVSALNWVSFAEFSLGWLKSSSPKSPVQFKTSLFPAKCLCPTNGRAAPFLSDWLSIYTANKLNWEYFQKYNQKRLYR